jgi:cobyrinic acid a,c-diamide synthase
MGFFYLSAAHKSSGKTTVAIGLAAALRVRRGLVVQPFKKGPDYIDPLWLGAAAGRPCYNLDFFVQTHDEIRAEFGRRMAGAGIGLVEGNKGLFDGVALDGSNSNAALAALLDAPVVLVIDSRGMTRGIAPLLLGYRQFTPRVSIAGVVLNRVGGSRHETKLRQAVEHYTDIPVVGAVPDTPGMQIVERHLGLMPSNEHAAAQAVVERIAAVVGDAVDLDQLERLAGKAVLPRFTPPPVSPSPAGNIARIGIPRDAAFGFYYPGDLEALEAAGAELVFFDALRDARLPAVDGLFIGGGFPESRMEALEANAALREDVRAFVEADGPVYAECGGLMYLCRRLTWRDKACRMAGVIPADAVMGDRPQGRGYVRLRETGSAPWPHDGPGPREIPAHEFHYSRLEHLDGDWTFAYDMLRGHGIDGRHDGVVYKNLLASYSHLRDVAGNHWARRFVAHVAACRERRRPAVQR